MFPENIKRIDRISDIEIASKLLLNLKNLDSGH